MTKILSISDDGVASGYGRIAMTINTRLVKRGYEVMAASLTYDGVLPANYEGEKLPYHVASLNGKANWPDIVVAMVNAWQPDVIWVTQDMHPYVSLIANAPLDWSRYAFVITTPVDGKPIYPPWIEIAKRADGFLTISEFGVQAWRETGVQAKLCRPGIDPDKFRPLLPEEKRAIRAKLGIPEDGFVVGMMSMNQGRKAIPQEIKAFFDFAQDKPNARLLLDMDSASPAGWDIPALCTQFSWPVEKIIFRAQAISRGVYDLNERYNALDVHGVLAMREGFGLPVLEAMAAGVVSFAQDWCAGTEVVGEGRGVLIPSVPYFIPSTWGGALDRLPDYDALTRKLQWLYDNPDARRALAKQGEEWARRQTWDIAVDTAASVINSALEKRANRARAIIPTAV